MMPMEINNHLEEEEIERYSLQDSPESELARVEEHLLICPSCQQRVESSDAHVQSMQQAAARMRQLPRRAPRWLGLPRFSFALAAGVLLVAAILVPRKAASPVSVSLTATRGVAIEARAPEGAPLKLQLDVTGLVPAPSYRVVMVDWAGNPVWTGAFPGAAVKSLPAGIYFVRLYAPAGDLLREYGLEIESPK